MTSFAADTRSDSSDRSVAPREGGPLLTGVNEGVSEVLRPALPVQPIMSSQDTRNLRQDVPACMSAITVQSGRVGLLLGQYVRGEGSGVGGGQGEPTDLSCI